MPIGVCFFRRLRKKNCSGVGRPEPGGHWHWPSRCGATNCCNVLLMQARGQVSRDKGNLSALLIPNLSFLGIMGTQFRAPLKHLEHHSTMASRCPREGLNWVPLWGEAWTPRTVNVNFSSMMDGKLDKQEKYEACVFYFRVSDLRDILMYGHQNNACCRRNSVPKATV